MEWNRTEATLHLLGSKLLKKRRRKKKGKRLNLNSKVYTASILESMLSIHTSFYLNKFIEPNE